MGSRRKQQGSFMLEALIGILIFFLGVLTMIALQASSIAIQTDSQYRAEASNLVDQMLGQINLNSRDNLGVVIPATLAGFAHRPTGGVQNCKLPETDPLAATDCCSFPDPASANPLVVAWVAAASANAATRLPWPDPATANRQQQIVVNSAVGGVTVNQVIVTVCWQGPKDARPRFHRVIGYVN